MSFQKPGYDLFTTSGFTILNLFTFNENGAKDIVIRWSLYVSILHFCGKIVSEEFRYQYRFLIVGCFSIKKQLNFFSSLRIAPIRSVSFILNVSSPVNFALTPSAAQQAITVCARSGQLVKSYEISRGILKFFLFPLIIHTPFLVKIESTPSCLNSKVATESPCKDLCFKPLIKNLLFPLIAAMLNQ